ncbi:MAG: SDR family NAD(P)-dependent oxidoreductase [Candidatus Azotimanducaceae bacterium WSBS_2022_MAG_OTU7]
MMNRLDKKVAVVTGGASGMGLSTVMRFLEEGASVVIADFNATTGTAVVEEATRLGYEGRISFIKTDVASEPDIVAMLDEAVSRFGRLDVLFNNAGVGGAIGPLMKPLPKTGITLSVCWPKVYSLGLNMASSHAGQGKVAQSLTQPLSY